MNPLVGVWSLVAWSARSSGGVTLPFGESPQGILVYTADGTMSASFMRASRTLLGLSPQEITNARRAWLGLDARAVAPPAEVRERFVDAALRFNAYAGRYALDGDRVHHDVEVALYPDWIGKRLTRAFRVDGERLTLSFEAHGQADSLQWRRRA